MAIINCPECEKEISDKAKKCVHCGKVFIEETEPVLRCVDCGAILGKADESCAKCGCPVEKERNGNGDREIPLGTADIDVRKKKNNILLIAVIVILILTAGGIGYKIYLNQARQEAYIDNVKKIQVLMLAGASDAEALCNLELKVWGNSIYERMDDETDKYTRPNGYFVDDFNDAFTNLFSDLKISTNVSDIEQNQLSVKDFMKKINDPQKEYYRCYETMLDLYEAYKKLTDLAIKPSGNYSGFSEDKKGAVSDFMSAYERLDNQISDK